MASRCGLAKSLNRLTLSTGKKFAPIALKSASNLIAKSSPSLTNNFAVKIQLRNFHLSAIYRADNIVVQGPAFAESISEGDIRWIKAVGDFVNEDEIVAEIETDKTSVECPAPRSGTIVKFLVEDGQKVGPKHKLYELAPGGAGAEKPVEVKTESKAEPVKETKVEAKAAPKAEAPKTANAGAIPKSAPPAAKPSGRPISSENVSGISPIKSAGAPPAEQTITGSREEYRVKMNRMRLKIASRLKEAQDTNAMLTTFNEVDMSSIMEMRKNYQKPFMAKHGIKLGLMSPFIKASAYALNNQPVVNAVIEDGEIIYRKYVDISVAVATPKGLVVPVLRNVEGQDYASIEHNLFALGEKARNNKIAVEDMTGGTFTISNGGVFGSMFGTPIINPPQSAILGMHGIFDRPVAVNGKVEIRPIMTIALTYDHRLIDGREAVTFLKTIKTAVEDPRTILMNL
uniref:Uncharacterized protein n=1 Tax=Rhabditophanes sp. KR3021 TaxID=114890 RepID=A0AC35TJJ5_9BILA